MLRLCAIVLWLGVCAHAKIPSFIKVCHASDPDLGGCIRASVLALRPILASGIPELDVPVLEPLSVDDVYIKGNLNINITDLKLHNLVNFEIQDLSASFEKYQFAFVLMFKDVRITGNYTIDAKLSAIQLQGHGPIEGVIGSTHVIGKLKGKRIMIGDKTHVEMRFLEFKIVDSKNVKFHLTGLFPDNKQLAEAATRIVEDSSDVLLEELIPALEEKLDKKVIEVSNKIVTKYSVNEIFPN